VPELKAIFDPANYVQCGQDTLQGWELVKSYVKYMHIKDATEGRVVPAGKGDGNVAAILKDFQAQGGDALTIEPHLKVFAGLAALEREGDTSEVGQFVYPTNDAAFDAACDALKGLLSEG
jgi:sugar phosphate isomerase/epimerase